MSASSHPSQRPATSRRFSCILLASSNRAPDTLPEPTSDAVETIMARPSRKRPSTDATLQQPDPTPQDAVTPPDPSPATTPGPGGRPGEVVDKSTQQVQLKKSNPEEIGFTPEVLDRTIIAI